MAATLAEIPLVDGQGYVQAKVELILRQERWDPPHNSLVQAPRCHERVQSQVQLLLVQYVRRLFSLRHRSFSSVRLETWRLVFEILFVSRLISLDVDKACLPRPLFFLSWSVLVCGCLLAHYWLLRSYNCLRVR